ncbi:MAG TPA: carboxylating nicotinate-nucleotide diphosphorylase [Candidatus Methanoperedenaceae archaeon]|nr:carboxylating nicotinate-nucleotide diphosphorylase [Candidatus Methanoperedenaceae archaeon]
MLTKELERFIEEDMGSLPYEIVRDINARAAIVAKEDGVLSGMAEALQVFRYFSVEARALREDGQEIHSGDIVLDAEGSAGGILMAERLALNFLGRMSGIATLTAQCMKKAGKVIIAGTRKTTPGFRKFEKKAIIAGGGDPHRYSLTDAVMVKDNHIALRGLENAVKNAKKAGFTRKVEVEVESAEDALLASELGADIVMFDNMTPAEIARCISAVRKRYPHVIIEASGGITPENLSEYAAAGVDVISMGALTRDARWLDFSLEVTVLTGRG